MNSFDRPTKSLLILCFACLSAVVYGLLSKNSERNKDDLRANGAGKIIYRSNDVRRKASHDVSWSQIPNQEKVYTEDHIFTGESSSAEIELKTGAKLTMNSNSLIVLREKVDHSEVKLSTGGFISRLRKGEKFNLLKNNKIIGFNADKDDVTVRVEQVKEDSDLTITVISGELQIEEQGQIKELKKNEILIVAKEPKVLSPTVTTTISTLLAEPKTKEEKTAAPNDSDLKKLFVVKPVSRQPSAVPENSEETIPQNATTNVTRAEELERPSIVKKRDFWIGGGFNYLKYSQSGTGSINSTSYETYGPTGMVGGSYALNSQLSLLGEHHYIPSDVGTNDTTVVSKNNYTWTTTLAEMHYRFSEDISPYNLFFITGFQSHQFPFMYQTNDSVIMLIDNHSLNAAVGLKLEIPRNNKWLYEANLRYQYPFSSSTSSGSIYISPQMSFDGLLGVSFKMDYGKKLGLYWFGQQHQFKYQHSAADAAADSSGSQTMFNSNIQLRFGWENIGEF